MGNYHVTTILVFVGLRNGEQDNYNTKNNYDLIFLSKYGF